MQLPDVNVLIYAHREDAPEHTRYVAWLRALTDSDEPFALSDAVLAGFLRIVTNPRIFDPPTPMDTAMRRLMLCSCFCLLSPNACVYDELGRPLPAPPASGNFATHS